MPTSPSWPGKNTASTSARMTSRRGVTTARDRGRSIGLQLRLHPFGLLEGLVEGADHPQGLLRQVVALAVADLLEGADGLLDLDILALEPRELLGHVEGLGEE